MATKERKRRKTIRKRKDIFLRENLRKKIERTMEERGETSEKRVEKILEKMRGRREIDGFLRTRHGSPLDRRGVDFVIFLFGGKRLFLQVKSSQMGAQEHLNVGKIKGQVVPVIIVTPLLSDEEIKENIFKIIREEGEEYQ